MDYDDDFYDSLGGHDYDDAEMPYPDWMEENLYGDYEPSPYDGTYSED